jgi:hypothetical protein
VKTDRLFDWISGIACLIATGALVFGIVVAYQHTHERHREPMERCR